MSTAPFIGWIIAGAVGALFVLAGAHVLNERRKLRAASKHGREASAAQMASGEPLTTFNRKGLPGDPLNMEIHGTDGQLGSSFLAAGWYRADEVDLITSIRISVDSILGRKYSTAPISNLYLFGRKEDYAFERPGNNVRQRDHIRFWHTGRVTDDGRPIWIGSATKDVKVELSRTNHLPTHGIAPDLDAERQLVVSELSQTGYVVSLSARPGFGKETHGANGGGDPYFTDGMIALLALANVWTHPLATHGHGALLCRTGQALERLLRWRLPREGRELAKRERARLRDEAGVRQPG
jgi:hypothetical protein